jgi:DNA (cytosine-5)-methyltransferase 1
MSGNHRNTRPPAADLAVQGYRPTRHDRPAGPAVLLPTPTAAAYGANQSLATGAAVRSSLATLAARLLPTPRTSDGRGPAAHGDGGADLRTAVWQLLPTPRASDGIKGCPAQRGSRGDLTLPSAAVRLQMTGDEAGTGRPDGDGGGGPLSTPRPPRARAASASPAADGCAGSRPQGQAAGITEAVQPRDAGSWDETHAAGQPATNTTAGRTWGPYTEAVARWQLLLGRPAPAPTQPGRHGKPVLAPPFVEWLMGLDAGWVTDLPLPRTLALRVLGNGVVPQQAAVALRLLLCPHRWAVHQ